MKKRTYFTTAFTDFFKELEENNHKEWFDENRKRYHAHVKEPFDDFIKDLLVEVGKIDPAINVPYNKCIFRINRDVRFSKDKTLYKTNRSAFISRFGTKNKSFPGMYFEINKNELRIYGGVYMLDAKQVYRIREEIQDYNKDFRKVITEKRFNSTFGEVQGEKAKRLNKEFQQFAASEDLMFNKNWYVYASLPLNTIYQEDLLNVMMDHYQVLEPFNKFFERPLLDMLNQ
ncbi:DUF2461 domain-containing protein [Parvicella tangerina]|uniref:DUF2461 domain-containing protein n=1 Tax=Parvicella tangerina TaxID=2829795 RepID=A0A916JL22_9FLAO|nr:DUF2461 domain-containing protein [Parvicella tangerina]CAG5079795.1 hypothetical protein CRYO30217_01070 [Parvicella tangerina]